MQTEKISIDWKVHKNLDEMEDYIEKWRILVWEHAYSFLFQKNGG